MSQSKDEKNSRVSFASNKNATNDAGQRRVLLERLLLSVLQELGVNLNTRHTPRHVERGIVRVLEQY